MADEKFRIWDAYWHDSRIYSAGVDADPAISQTLDQQWGLLARVMPDGARVLDVARGNGAVGLAMMRANQDGGPNLSITGIDSAAIDPPRFVTEHAALLRTISFRPMVKMESLPFEDDSFDVVVSQFGLEYGSPREALTEAVRVLRSHGLLTLLCLPARSAAIHAANKGLKQCKHLLRDAPLFDIAMNATQHLHQALAAGQDDGGPILAPFNAEVERIVRKFGNDECDVVFAIVLGLQKVFIDRKTASLEDQIKAIQLLRTRLAEYAARAQALTRAALTDSDLEELKRNIATVGFKLTEVKPILVGAYGTVAWRVSAERLARPALPN